TQSGSTTQYIDAGLSPGAAYAYAIQATSASNAGVVPSPASAITTMTAPVASVGTTTTSSVPLSWPTIAGVAGFRVYRSTDNGATFPRLGSDPTVGPGATGYTDSAVTPGTKYQYKVEVVGTAPNTF